jgi:hypothetical protein
MALVIAAVPILALAAATFDDVPPSSPYFSDITALANAGVTTGCGGGNYCPKDTVTREQMAAFMNRLGALSAGKTPVVNATKLDGIDSTGFLQSGPIVVQQLGPWEPWQTSPVTVTRSFGESTVKSAAASDGGGVVMALNLPVSIAGRTYGFKSAKVCYIGTSVGAILVGAFVTQSTDTGADGDLVADETERSLDSSACFVLTKSTPIAAVGSTTVRLHFEWQSAGTVLRVRSTTITWLPVAP